MADPFQLVDGLCPVAPFRQVVCPCRALRVPRRQIASAVDDLRWLACAYPIVKCRRPPQWVAFDQMLSGGVLLSHAVTRAVPSALRGLASGFGMEPGVSLLPWPPKRYGVLVGFPTETRELHSGREVLHVRQVLGLLVPVSSTHCCASTSGLSTQSSGWGPYPVNPVGILILEPASRLDAFSGYPFRT